MSKWIEADAFLKEYCEPYPHIYKAMSRAMADAPSIDIVRCGECKWFNEKYGSCHAYHWDLNQGLEYAEVDADDFCSYGEREGE